MSLILQSSGGGQITIQEPTTASNFTQTLPAASGVTMVSGNMPAFSAYNSNLQSVATSTYTKIQFNTEEFDTNSNYDNATNYRFTPTVAGYYQVNLFIGNASGTATGTYTIAAIYKNGSVFKSCLFQGATNGPATIVSAIIQMNGTTDYLEGYYFQNSGLTQNTSAGQAVTVFSAAMIRGA